MRQTLGETSMRDADLRERAQFILFCVCNTNRRISHWIAHLSRTVYDRIIIGGRARSLHLLLIPASHIYTVIFALHKLKLFGRKTFLLHELFILFAFLSVWRYTRDERADENATVSIEVTYETDLSREAKSIESLL